MIKSELRATVSSGLTRPPTSTGMLPNFAKSNSSFGVFGGNQLAPIDTAATTKMIHGKKRFMRLLSVADAKIRRDENQIAQEDPRPGRGGETGGVHHLANSPGSFWVGPGLIKCFAAIAKRMIHVNQHVTVHRSVRVDQCNFAREIFRYFCTGILVVRKLLQCHAIWFVVARWPHRNHPRATAAGKCLRRAERI